MKIYPRVVEVQSGKDQVDVKASEGSTWLAAELLQCRLHYTQLLRQTAPHAFPIHNVYINYICLTL